MLAAGGLVLVTDASALEQLVAFTFLLTFFTMAAAAVFLFAERSQVSPDFRMSVAISALVCAIAAGNYLVMRQVYVDGLAGEGTAFPTEYRYVDWFLTVPLMLALFPAHLGLGRRGWPFMAWLVAMSLVMLGFGYVGEVNSDDPVIHLGAWALGGVAALAIYVPLFASLRQLPERVPRHTVVTIRAMTALVLIGWTVYPLGYLQPTLGFPPDLRELLYNVGDLVNKGGLGLLVFLGGRAALRAERQAPPTAGPDRDASPRTPVESLFATRR